jgi:hypothetical protein
MSEQEQHGQLPNIRFALGERIVERTNSRRAHAYTLVAVKPYQTKAGASSALLTSAGNCAVCGETFTAIRAGARASWRGPASAIAARCGRAGRRWPMPDGINFTETGMMLAALAATRRWVAWQTQDRPDADKPTKAPINPANGRNAAADKPSTLGSRDAAEQRAAKRPKPHGAGGVGIILGAREGLVIGGLDQDTCRDPGTGFLADWTKPFTAALSTYGKVSPSGTGIKFSFRYDPAALPELQQAMGTKTEKQWKQQGGDHPPGVELYLCNRFFAVTDDAIGAEPVNMIPTATLLHVIRDLGPAAFAKPKDEAGGTKASSGDRSRSARVMATAARVKGSGGTMEQFVQAFDHDRDTSAWKAEKGMANGGRELRRTWDNCRANSEPEWLDQCQTNDRGEPRGNLFNGMIALQHEHAVSTIFRLDEMLRAPVIITPDGIRVVTDADVSRVQVHLQQCGSETLSKDTAHEAVDLRATELAFHPVRDYLGRAALGWGSEGSMGCCTPISAPLTANMPSRSAPGS